MRPANAATPKVPLVTAEAALEADAEAEVADLVALAALAAEREAEDTAEVAADAALVAAAEEAAGVVAAPLVTGAELPATPVPETCAFTQDESEEFWIVTAEEYWRAPVLSRT